jgi:hypothetical protein
VTAALEIGATVVVPIVNAPTASMIAKASMTACDGFISALLSGPRWQRAQSRVSPIESLNNFSDLRCGECHKIGDLPSIRRQSWLAAARIGY